MKLLSASIWILLQEIIRIYGSQGHHKKKKMALEAVFD